VANEVRSVHPVSRVSRLAIFTNIKDDRGIPTQFCHSLHLTGLIAAPWASDEHLLVAGEAWRSHYFDRFAPKRPPFGRLAGDEDALLALRRFAERLGEKTILTIL